MQLLLALGRCLERNRGRGRCNNLRLGCIVREGNKNLSNKFRGNNRRGNIYSTVIIIALLELLRKKLRMKIVNSIKKAQASCKMVRLIGGIKIIRKELVQIHNLRISICGRKILK